jgi:hypothetical protein
MREEIKEALENKSEATQTYFWSFVALVEEYVARMNANNRDLELFYKLQNELSEKTEALYAAYVKEREDQGLPPEVGRAFC